VAVINNQWRKYNGSKNVWVKRRGSVIESMAIGLCEDKMAYRPSEEMAICGVLAAIAYRTQSTKLKILSMQKIWRLSVKTGEAGLSAVLGYPNSGLAIGSVSTA